MAKKKKKYHPNHKGQTRCKYQYECIDGNLTFYPVALCKYHQGVLTQGLMKNDETTEA